MIRELFDDKTKVYLGENKDNGKEDFYEKYGKEYLMYLEKVYKDTKDQIKRLSKISPEFQKRFYLLILETRILKHMQMRSEKNKIELLSDMRSKVGFFNIFKMFEKYHLLTIEVKNLRERLDQQEETDSQGNAPSKKKKW